MEEEKRPDENNMRTKVVYSEYLNDNKGRIDETSATIHNGMNVAARKLAYQLERQNKSPVNVQQLDETIEKVGNYIFPGGNKMLYPENNRKLDLDKKLRKENVVQLAGLDYKTNKDNLDKLKEMQKDLPEELREQYNTIQHLIKQVPENASDCKEKAFNNDVNKQIDKAIDRLENQKNDFNMKKRIQRLVGEEPTKRELKKTKEALAAIQKQNKRARQEMKEMLVSVMQSLENTNDVVKAEAEFQNAHRNQQFMFRRKVREFQRRSDEWRDLLMDKVNNIQSKVNKIDATVNARKMTWGNASYIWLVWYGEDIFNMFKSAYYRKGWGDFFLKVFQPLFTSCQILIGWLNEVIKAIARLYNCLRESPLLCLLTEVAVILAVVLAGFCLYVLIHQFAPGLWAGAKFLLQGAVSWLGWTFSKIVEYIGPEFCKSISDMFWDGWQWCKDLLYQLVSFIYNKSISSFGPILNSIKSFFIRMAGQLKQYIQEYVWDTIRKRIPWPGMSSLIRTPWSYKDYVLTVTGVRPHDLKCFDIKQRLELFGYKNMKSFEVCKMSSIVAPFIFIHNNKKALKF